jgi:glycosyltransferase involved in cell wall biosynthesis
MTSSADVLRLAVRPAARRVAALATARWPPRSRLFLVGEDAGWVIDYELRRLAEVAERLGARVAGRRLLNASSDQAAFYGSQFALLREPWTPVRHALATAYFHGRPGTPGEPAFDACYEALRTRHRELDRVQVSHSEIHELVLSSGIDPAKVFRIPIGVDSASFMPQDAASRDAARAALGLPRDAFVVGSFQKDGIGFGDGREPKAIKGPDVLLDALRALHARVPELHILLTGPARSYVRDGLERLGIPYRHLVFERYAELTALYAALDVYVVPSRQEGGPKGVLEAMAGGVPVVTTRVGQAMDLVRHGENGWMVDVEDAEGLAHWLAHVAFRPANLEAVVAEGQHTARANDYRAQEPLWRAFLDGFVRLRR